MKKTTMVLSLATVFAFAGACADVGDVGESEPYSAWEEELIGEIGEIRPKLCYPREAACGNAEDLTIQGNGAAFWAIYENVDGCYAPWGVPWGDEINFWMGRAKAAGENAKDSFHNAFVSCQCGAASDGVYYLDAHLDGAIFNAQAAQDACLQFCPENVLACAGVQDALDAYIAALSAGQNCEAVLCGNNR